jgi:hypothetical protein
VATINGLTAERLLQLEADTVIGGHVDGDNLILEQHDGSTINAGSVRGFPGISDMALYDPVGVPKPYMGAAAPTGYGLCNADTPYDGALYPELAAMFDTGAACINGPTTAGHFLLPDLRGKFLVGLHGGIGVFDTLHETGGSKDSIIVTHAHTATQPAHGHAVSVQGGNADHYHGTGDGGAHSHSVDGGDFGDRIVVSYGSNIVGAFLASDSGYDIAYTHFDAAPNHNHGNTGGASGAANHGHGTNQSDATPAITVNNATGGASGTDKNLPPYRVVNYIMRLA